MNDAPEEGELYNELAGIEYVGVAGASKDCQDGVLRYIQFGDHITATKILTCSRDHCLLLTLEGVDQVAVKSGFASGYGGEGPHRFSYVLQALESHGSKIEEFDVTSEFLERLDNSALTCSDLGFLADSRPRRPSRWHDYISKNHFEDARSGSFWREEFPIIIPFALLDKRMIDLALSFWNSPDNGLLVGYRRLEDIVRERTGLKEHGAKLFSQAFNPNGGRLTWDATDEGERAGRMQLFTGTYSAHRNRRAHKELRAHADELAAEFLLLNHLYRLEKDAVEV